MLKVEAEGWNVLTSGGVSRSVRGGATRPFLAPLPAEEAGPEATVFEGVEFGFQADAVFREG